MTLAQCFVKELEDLDASLENGLTERAFGVLISRFPHQKDGDDLIFQDGTRATFNWDTHQFIADDANTATV